MQKINYSRSQIFIEHLLATATSKTWTQTLDPGTGPCTQTLDPGLGPWTRTPNPGPWTWTLKNLDPEKPEL